MGGRGLRRIFNPGRERTSQPHPTLARFRSAPPRPKNILGGLSRENLPGGTIYKNPAGVSEASRIAGIRLARERQVNVRVIPTSHAIDESLDLAHEIYNRVFRKVPENIAPK